MYRVKLAVCLIAGFIAGRMCTEPCRRTSTDGMPAIIEIHDTVRITEPVTVAAHQVETRIAILPLADTADSTMDTTPDSAAVCVPVESVEYGGDGYRAWVSGWRPRLDSIYIDRVSVTERVPAPSAPRRFSIGIQAGYGMTPAGPQPYVGVGVAYRIF